MIQKKPPFSIPPAEIQLEFVRSSGPGGQNVNKVATAVQLRFDVRSSPSLPQEVRERLMLLAGKRLTTDGILIIQARRFRTQERNRADALERLYELLEQAARKPKQRLKTCLPHGVREQRLQGKHIHAKRKTLRRSIDRGDD